MVQNAFVALDFETANSKRTSICSVGMVKVIDNQITESFHTLVNPFDYFTETNITVHPSRRCARCSWIQACLSIYAKIY